MNIHARGQALLNRTTRTDAGTGVAVTYTRAGVGHTLTATPAVIQQDAVTAPTPNTRSADRERDYLIVFADLVTAGLNEPQEGDRITETINGASVVFEAIRNRTEPFWKWADAQRTRVQIHTKRKAVS